MPEYAVSVQGPDFDEPLSLQDFLKSYERIGFQANSLGKAIGIVNRMVRSLSLKVMIHITKWVYSAQMASIR